MFLECPYRDACTGAEGCAVGYEGYKCSQCNDVGGGGGVLISKGGILETYTILCYCFFFFVFVSVDFVFFLLLYFTILGIIISAFDRSRSLFYFCCCI